MLIFIIFIHIHFGMQIVRQNGKYIIDAMIASNAPIILSNTNPAVSHHFLKIKIQKYYVG